MKRVFCITAFTISVLFGMRHAAFAKPIAIAITAEVDEVDDMGGFLGGQINVGDVITGMYLYESTTPDTSPLPTVGEYRHTTSPFGMTLSAGGFVFRTDPSDVDFLVEIVNDFGSPAKDIYGVTSYNNIFEIPLPSEELVKEKMMGFGLVDPTHTALSSIALPTVPPNLANWQSTVNLLVDTFTVHGDRIFFGAHVTSAVLMPGYTPPGNNVIVEPVDPDPVVGDGTYVTVNFNNVTIAGETTVTSSETGKPPAAAFKLGNQPLYFTIETTAGYAPPVQVCFDYSDINYGDDNSLILFYWKAPSWINVTDPGYPDSTNNIICGTVNSLP